MERFEAKLVAADRGAAYIEVPPGVVAALGGKGRIPVLATFDGIEYRGSIVSMGAGADRRDASHLRDAQLLPPPGVRRLGRRGQAPRHPGPAHRRDG